MPELPEVEAARRLIHKHCAGSKQVKIVVATDDSSAFPSGGMHKPLAWPHECMHVFLTCSTHACL